MRRARKMRKGPRGGGSRGSSLPAAAATEKNVHPPIPPAPSLPIHPSAPPKKQELRSFPIPLPQTTSRLTGHHRPFARFASNKLELQNPKVISRPRPASAQFPEIFNIIIHQHPITLNNSPQVYLHSLLRISKLNRYVICSIYSSA